MCCKIFIHEKIVAYILLFSGDGKGYTNNQKFSAIDRDNDKDSYVHCARDSRKGGWWHHGCTPININGITMTAGYNGLDAVYYQRWRDFNALRSTKMMIRPQQIPT